jgi:tetratricopeptide (TPR) repeat protein
MRLAKPCGSLTNIFSSIRATFARSSTRPIISLRMQEFSQAETALSAALKQDPKSIQALLTQSALYIQTQRYTNAVESVNRVLSIDANNQAAIMNRAIALLQSGDLEAAKQDYLLLHNACPNCIASTSAWQKLPDNRTTPIPPFQFYQLYLQHAPTDSEEAKLVAQRLEQLQP